MPMRRASFDILIAGAGPVGLLFATRLWRQRRRAGFSLRIVDGKAPARWQTGRTDARVYALSRESQGALGELWSEIAARRVSPYRRMCVFEGESPAAGARVAFDAADIGEPDLGHIVEDNLIRTVLLDYLTHGGVEIAFGAGIEALDHRGGKVHVSMSDGQKLEADVVIGADGTASSVRTAAGIELIRKDYAQRAVVAHVTTGLPHRETAWQRFLNAGPLAFLPLADGRSSIVWTSGQSDSKRLLALADGDFLRELEAASGGILGRLGSATARLSFPLQLQHAVRYTRPGIVLIGDSAHAVHPLAGQGMNLGLRDAAVLADTLIAAMAAGEYPGDDRVLRRYERAQKAHNLGMQLAFDGLNELFGPRLPAWTAPIRGAGMALLNRSAPAKRLLMRRALGLDRLVGLGSSDSDAA